MKQGLVRLLYNFGKRFMGWTLHMIMCVLLYYPVSIHMSQLLSTGRPISSSFQTPGAVFTKGLSQVLGLRWLYFCTKVKPKTWLRPFVNTAPVDQGLI